MEQKNRYCFSEVVVNEDGTSLETIFRPDKTKEQEILYLNANDNIPYGPDRARIETTFCKDGTTVEVIREYKEGNNRNLKGYEKKTNLVKIKYFKDIPNV